MVFPSSPPNYIKPVAVSPTSPSTTIAHPDTGSPPRCPPERGARIMITASRVRLYRDVLFGAPAVRVRFKGFNVIYSRVFLDGKNEMLSALASPTPSLRLWRDARAQTIVAWIYGRTHGVAAKWEEKIRNERAFGTI